MNIREAHERSSLHGGDFAMGNKPSSTEVSHMLNEPLQEASPHKMQQISDGLSQIGRLIQQL